MTRRKTDVYIETGTRRVFACALDWPGWCRSAKDEQGALDALAAAGPRYADVAEEAGLPLPEGAADALQIVARVKGSATTDFGAPGAIAPTDGGPMTAQESERLASLVAASWRVLERVAANAPAELRKGPRGGGRDRDAVVEHVVAAEASYARSVGIPGAKASAADRASVAALRLQILDALHAAPGKTPPEKGWPARYAARRVAWHVLDHAWEIEDRS